MSDVSTFNGPSLKPARRGFNDGYSARTVSVLPGFESLLAQQLYRRGYREGREVRALERKYPAEFLKRSLAGDAMRWRDLTALNAR